MNENGRKSFECGEPITRGTPKSASPGGQLTKSWRHLRWICATITSRHRHFQMPEGDEMTNLQKMQIALADEIEARTQSNTMQDLFLNRAERGLIVSALRLAAQSAGEPPTAREEFDPAHSLGDYDFAAIDDLVARFALALREKLRASEVKYGHNSGWMRDDWKDDCQRQLLEHVAKGDPRDVAAYCAFMWHHDWSAAALSVPLGDQAREADLAACLKKTREQLVKVRDAIIESGVLNNRDKYLGLGLETNTVIARAWHVLNFEE